MRGYNKEEIINFIKKKYYVYGLINPINNNVFYIGKGSAKRLFEHEIKVLNRYKFKKNQNNHLLNTIKKIYFNKLKLKYIILFNNDDEKLTYEKEKYFIKNLI